MPWFLILFFGILVFHFIRFIFRMIRYGLAARRLVVAEAASGWGRGSVVAALAAVADGAVVVEEAASEASVVAAQEEVAQVAAGNRQWEIQRRNSTSWCRGCAKPPAGELVSTVVYGSAAGKEFRTQLQRHQYIDSCR